MNTESGDDSRARARSLRRLKWGAILLPTLFILWSETVRHRFFDDAPVWLGNLVTATVAFLGSYFFAHLMFRLIERIEAAFIARNQRLAVLEERDRIARELHDGLAQLLAAITLQSERAHASLADGNTQAARVAVERIAQASSAAYADVREAIVGLRTGAETDFPDALRETAEWFSDTTAIAVTVDVDITPGLLPPLAELQFLRIVQESLTNVRKHARASHVWITAARDAEGALHLTIRDDGIGFDPDHVPRGGRQHFGLLIMRERVESFGGVLSIAAAADAGTIITATLPNVAAEARGAA